MVVSLRATVMVDVCLAADDPNGARHHLREAMALWTPMDFHVQHWYAMLVRHRESILYVGMGERLREGAARCAGSEEELSLHSDVRGFTAYIRGVQRDRVSRWRGRSRFAPCAREGGAAYGPAARRERGAWGPPLACLVLAAAANAP